MQGSQTAVQATLSAADANLGIGVILFGQSMGPAVFIAIAQVIFTNELSSSLRDIVPGLAPADEPTAAPSAKDAPKIQ